MKSKYFLYWIMLAAVLLLPFHDIQAGNTDVSVFYSYNGKQNFITGKKIGWNRYVFNKGASKKITIATLDWPPYIGQEICNQGWVQQLTVALLASQGYEVTSIFYPWGRAVRQAELGRVDILYPDYFIGPDAPSDVISDTKRLDHLALSTKFPGGPLMFMKRKGEKDNYKGNFQNLKGEKIGVVSGYQNTDEFDSLMDKGFFDIDAADDDFSNAKKLIYKRTNLIIGDPAVIRFSVKTSELEPEKRAYILNNLESVMPVIQYNYLYYVFSKKRTGWKMRLIAINKAIKEFEESGEMFRIIESTNTDCGFKMESLIPYQQK